MTPEKLNVANVATIELERVSNGLFPEIQLPEALIARIEGRPIEELGLKFSTEVCLRSSGFRMIGQALGKDEYELCRKTGLISADTGSIRSRIMELIRTQEPESFATIGYFNRLLPELDLPGGLLAATGPVPVTQLSLSVNLKKALKSAGFEIIGQVLGANGKSLLLRERIAELSLSQIKSTLLTRFGLRSFG